MTKIIYVKHQNEADKLKELGLVEVRSNIPKVFAFSFNHPNNQFAWDETTQKVFLDHLSECGIRYATSNTLVL